LTATGRNPGTDALSSRRRSTRSPVGNVVSSIWNAVGWTRVGEATPVVSTLCPAWGAAAFRSRVEGRAVAGRSSSGVGRAGRGRRDPVLRLFETPDRFGRAGGGRVRSSTGLAVRAVLPRCGGSRRGRDRGRLRSAHSHGFAARLDGGRPFPPSPRTDRMVGSRFGARGPRARVDGGNCLPVSRLESAGAAASPTFTARSPTHASSTGFRCSDFPAWFRSTCNTAIPRPRSRDWRCRDFSSISRRVSI